MTPTYQTRATNGDSPATGGSAIETGRALLEDWERAQPDNFFSADIQLQRMLEYHWGRDAFRKEAPALYRFGHVLAAEVDTLARESELVGNLPRLERHDRLGRRMEEVVFHPAYHEAGRRIYGSGLLSAYAAPGHNLLALALFYLSSQNGEAGHNCPVACTAGLIKALQAVGSPALAERYLPGLTDPDYESHLTGAQFLTEIQGGSDVGANASLASPLDAAAGSWLITGEKWFCSNVNADLALVTARVEGLGEGTRGLGLFLVPRVLPDGRLNNLTVTRLKDKLGTRSMATGELELREALAYQVGPIEHGFKNVMVYVINTSRIYNALGCSGNARRAFVIARSYADYRTAFGQAIIHFPLVQDLLANMRADAAAILAGSLRIARTMDQLELGEISDESAAYLRMAINLNKYRSSVIAHEVINRAIELLGGNGAIEDFSVLPRLLRDNVVFENWEGTHNVLLAQVQRDVRRYQVERPLLALIRADLEALEPGALRDEGLSYLARIEAELREVLAMDELTAAIYFRPLMDRLTDLYYTSSLAAVGQWEERERKERTTLRLAALTLRRRVGRLEPKDIPYYDDLVSRLCR
jgi:alkylation response protein AidB-like acyl-CoA dehydrogenase